MNDIRTPRLRLQLLSCQQMYRYLSDPEKLEPELGVSVSRDVLTSDLRDSIFYKTLRMTSTKREFDPWLGYWLMVAPASSFGAGLISFKGAPDRNGMVEIGYAIDPLWQNQGYTTEAAAGLIVWAFDQPDCKVITAETRRENAASMRVLQKLGLRITGENETYYFWSSARM